ncbi:hypothetical protein MMC10_009222 [Thelotrema lepadinum]|nr:hypothetical protein [Thelotrema lepadinum]
MERHVSKGYTLPEAFLDLDEVAAPSPIQNRGEERYYRSGSLERSLSLSRVSPPSSRAERSENEQNNWPLVHDNLERRVSRNSQNRRSRPLSYHGQLNEIVAPPPVDRPATIDEKPSDETLNISRRRQQASQFATQLYTICYLVFFSILGTLARLGLQALTVYPGEPVTQTVLWANFGGSLVMGFLAEDRSLFREEWGPKHKDTPPGKLPPNERGDLERLDSNARRERHGAVKKTIPLYIGLATGFCGSFTSFSSWQRDLFLALSNSAPTSNTTPNQTSTPIPRNPGFSFLAFLATLIITPTLCLGALQAGAHLAIALEPILPSLPYPFMRRFLDPTIAILSLLAWLGAIVMTVLPPDRPGGLVPPSASSWAQETWRGDALFALVFAPMGCLLRFYLSLGLNSQIPSFPLGTFIANILGTLCLATFYDLQRVPIALVGRVGCQVLQGMEDGFCGCLTTVSTWVVELKGLKRWHAYVYGTASTMGGLVVTVVVMGSVLWARGWEATACGK